MATTTRFLGGKQVVWAELRKLADSANRPVSAVVAYFGSDGCDLLKLKKGDTLLVDMSLGAVRQGVTDPREIQKLYDRQVRIYSRDCLHAKVYLIDDVLVCGSANVSNNSCNGLDEACVITTDRSAIRAARAYMQKMCSEPVTEQYLEQCLKEYRPPRFKAAATPRRPAQGRRAKVWFIGGISPYDPSEKEQERIDAAISDAEDELPRDGHEIAWIRYQKKPKFLTQIQKHNWVIDAMWQGGKRRLVGPPAQVLRKRTYTSSRGVKTHLLVMARPTDGEAMTYSDWRRRGGEIVPELNSYRATTRPVANSDVADKLLRLWTKTGSIRKIGGRQ
jgi:hypothetical protein